MDVHKLSLEGEWTLSQSGDGGSGESLGDSIRARVPGDVYRDLLDAGRIDDPFYRDNEEYLQWIGESDWTYSREFSIPEELLQKEHVRLRCEGLDTFADVTVNGRELARTDNMFRTWEWDVRPLLTPGTNRISIHFRSTLPYIRSNEAQQALRYGAGKHPWIKAASHGWVRKEQCNYGWDWGIRAVTAGIWRPIYLLAFDRGRLSDVAIRQDHTSGRDVTVRVLLDADAKPSAGLRASLSLHRAGELVTGDDVALEDGAGVGELRVENPQLWWPNGLGDQPLYDLHVELRDERDKLLDETDKRIGLRTLRLDRHEDEWGESFHFVVNGLAFFAKGANWIPADAVQSRMSPAWYRHLVEEAAAVHMNMLRVWGGGLYEDDSFYQACDENGICVWQDFMFACAAYPSYDEQFLQSVAAEARDNVRRLRHHPSLALWCGNNEIEQMGMVSERGWEQGEMTWNSYKHLFDEILPNIVRELHPEAAYWPSSPHSPREDRTDMNNPRWGDAHLWGVWHGQQPFEWYRTCEHRFNSEFGFQSFPEPRTVKQYTAPEDRNVTSRIMEHHQRSGVGNTRIMQYMLDWFRLPVGFENTLWTSQILQGMAMKYACEHWRRTMPRGMGTLYWQLNDTWPVASWSSIDYFGRWKALHYMAQHFYAPILVSAVEDVDAGIARLYVSNDLPVHVTGAVTWTVTDLAGNKLREDRCEFTQNATSTSEIGVAEVGDLIARYRPWGILMWLALDDGSAVKSRNLVLFARPKHLELSREPGISAQVEQADHGGVRLRLETKKPALWVWLDLGRNDARFSDNFFNLVPGVPHCVSLETDPSLSAEQIAQGIGIRSLVDTYTEKPTHGG